MFRVKRRILQVLLFYTTFQGPYEGYFPPSSSFSNFYTFYNYM